MAFFSVYDSTDKKVGEFVSLNGNNSAYVQFKVSNKYYTLAVFCDRIGEVAPDSFDGKTLYYSTTDCSGQAYVEYKTLCDEGAIFPHVDLTEQGSILFSQPTETSQTITVRSTKQVGGSCQAVDIPYTLSVVPAVFGPDFRTGFTPPFRFE